jgi:hypothetical protein
LNPFRVTRPCPPQRVLWVKPILLAQVTPVEGPHNAVSGQPGRKCGRLARFAASRQGDGVDVPEQCGESARMVEAPSYGDVCHSRAVTWVRFAQLVVGPLETELADVLMGGSRTPCEIPTRVNRMLFMTRSSIFVADLEGHVARNRGYG